MRWKSECLSDIYCDIERLKQHEHQRSISESKQLEGLITADNNIEHSRSQYSNSGLSGSFSLYNAEIEMDEMQKSASFHSSRSPSNSFNHLEPQKLKKAKSKSRRSSTFKSIKKRLSVLGKQNKKNNLSMGSDLGDVDELRAYGFDNDVVPLAEDQNEIYFLMGSVFVDGNDGKEVNLYQEIQKVRKKIHKNLAKGKSSKDEMINAAFVNDAFFIQRI